MAKMECVICRDSVVVPSKLISTKCGCWNKNIYCCLTCIYLALNYDGNVFTKLRCFMCNTTLNFIQPFKPTNYYTVKKELLENVTMDCQHLCGWNGNQLDYQKHLRKKCLKAKNTKCSICKRCFTKSEYFEHVKNARQNNDEIKRSFCADEKCCVKCNIIFKSYNKFLNHLC